MIKVSQLLKTVPTADGDLTILRGVDLEIVAGTSAAIVGASGSGKSTLLGLLAGMDVASAGEVWLDGVNLSALDEDARARLRAEKVGFVFQNFQLLPALTAKENVMLPLELAGIDEAGSIAERFLAEVGLQDRLGHYPTTLSGGEQQRVAIARAVLKDAPVLVFDEATSSLDSESERAVMSAFRALAGHHTAVVIAHRLSTIVDADRILVLEEGRLVEQGCHDDLLTRNGRYTALWQAQQRETEPSIDHS